MSRVWGGGNITKISATKNTLSGMEASVGVSPRCDRPTNPSLSLVGSVSPSCLCVVVATRDRARCAFRPSPLNFEFKNRKPPSRLSCGYRGRNRLRRRDSSNHGESPPQLRYKMDSPRCPLFFPLNHRPSRTLKRWEFEQQYRQSPWEYAAKVSRYNP